MNIGTLKVEIIGTERYVAPWFACGTSARTRKRLLWCARENAPMPVIQRVSVQCVQRVRRNK